MLTEEAKQRLIKELSYYSDHVTEEDVEYAKDLILNSFSIDDRDRRIVKLRIIDGMTYKEITRMLDLKKDHVVPNRFKSTMRYLRKQLRIHNRPNDGTEQLSEILSSRIARLQLAKNEIYTVGQFIERLEKDDFSSEVPVASTIVYLLESKGHNNLRSIVKDQQILKELAEMDRRNYRHIRELEQIFNRNKDVLSSEITKSSYTHSSLSEFGTIKLVLSNYQHAKIKVAIDFNFNFYRFCIELNHFDRSDGFDYLQTVERTFEAKFDELEKAVNASINYCLEMTN